MPRPTWARWVTRISLALAIVALIFTIRDIGLATIAEKFEEIGWWWIAVVVLEIVVTTLDAIAIRAFLSPEQKQVKLRSALLSQLAGRAVNAVTPSGNLGEAVKVSVLVDFVSQSRAVATILLYNLVSFSVELITVGVAAPFVAMFVPMPTSLRWIVIATGAIVLVVAVALYALVRRGVLVTAAKLACRIPIPGLAFARRRIWKLPNATNALLSKHRFEKWEPRLKSVDDKMKLVEGARTRDRWIGICAITLSRLTSMTLSLMILHAVGEPITARLVAVYTVGGFVIYMTGTLVPMGIGINEGGYYAMFKSLSHSPERGVTLALARRVTLVVYAGIGLILVTASETVQRARERQQQKLAASGQIPRIVTAPPQVTPAAVTKAAE